MMGDDAAAQVLPPSLLELLDGTKLDQKVGTTLLLTAAPAAGFPHTALLSVGEVYATSPTEVRLALYATSRTTQAAKDSGRALLMTVLDGHVHKVYLDLTPVTQVEVESEANMLFAGHVREVEEDRVGYARITSGVTYELNDTGAVLHRWERQVMVLSGLASTKD